MDEKVRKIIVDNIPAWNKEDAIFDWSIEDCVCIVLHVSPGVPFSLSDIPGVVNGIPIILRVEGIANNEQEIE